MGHVFVSDSTVREPSALCWQSKRKMFSDQMRFMFNLLKQGVIHEKPKQPGNA